MEPLGYAPQTGRINVIISPECSLRHERWRYKVGLTHGAMLKDCCAHQAERN